MDKKTQILENFKSNFIQFIDALVEQFPSETDLYLVKVLFSTEQVSPQLMMQLFMERIYPNKKLIEKRDEKFFIENEDIFSGISNDKVGHFKRLWMSGILDDSDKVEVWRWFDVFIMLCDMYISETK